MARSSFPNTNLAASTKTANILAGDINEFTTARSLVNVYAVSSAAGIRATILAGQDVVMDDKEIVAIGTTVSIPDHLLTSFAVEPGTRLAIFLRETAAAATTDVPLIVDVNPY